MSTEGAIALYEVEPDVADQYMKLFTQLYRGENDKIVGVNGNFLEGAFVVTVKKGDLFGDVYICLGGEALRTLRCGGCYDPAPTVGTPRWYQLLPPFNCPSHSGQYHNSLLINNLPYNPDFETFLGPWKSARYIVLKLGVEWDTSTKLLFVSDMLDIQLGDTGVKTHHYTGPSTVVLTQHQDRYVLYTEDSPKADVASVKQLPLHPMVVDFLDHIAESPNLLTELAKSNDPLTDSKLLHSWLRHVYPAYLFT